MHPNRVIRADSIRDRCPSGASGTCGAHPAGVKRSDQPTAPRLPAQTATGFMGSAVCRCPLDTPGSTIGESGSHWCVIEASTVALPSIGMEIGDWSRHRRVLIRCSPFQGSMRALMVEVCAEIEQLVFEIRRSRTTCDPNSRVESCRFVAIPVMWRRSQRGPSGFSAPRPLHNISCFGLLYSRAGYSIPNYGGRKCLMSF